MGTVPRFDFAVEENNSARTETTAERTMQPLPRRSRGLGTRQILRCFDILQFLLAMQKYIGSEK